MFDWIASIMVILIGFFIMVTGWIEYVFIGYMCYLLMLVVLSIIARIWRHFQY